MEAKPLTYSSDVSPPFMPLGKVTTTAATPHTISFENIKINIARGLTRFHELPEFQQIKGKDAVISLVGGGPSINTENVKKDLYYYAAKGPVIACGSSHDWCVDNGIFPDYTVICDPDPISALYLERDNPNVSAIYLVASACDSAVFERLNALGKKIVLWHCHSDELGPELVKMENEYQAIGGGCTVGLRSISIAMMLGYTNLHMFGFDSSLGDDLSHHAYGFKDEEKEFLGDVHKVKVGVEGPGERVYYCAGYQLAQVAHFKEFYTMHRHLFSPTFHGTGLLPDFMKLAAEMEAREAKK